MQPSNVVIEIEGNIRISGGWGRARACKKVFALLLPCVSTDLEIIADSVVHKIYWIYSDQENKKIFIRYEGQWWRTRGPFRPFFPKTVKKVSGGVGAYGGGGLRLWPKLLHCWRVSLIICRQTILVCVFATTQLSKLKPF